MRVNGEALQLHAVYKKLYFLLQVTRESISALQVTWESISGTTSHARNLYQVLQVTCDTCFWTEEKSVQDCQTDYFTRLKIADNYTGKDEIATDEGLVSITVMQILKYADT